MAKQANIFRHGVLRRSQNFEQTIEKAMVQFFRGQGPPDAQAPMSARDCYMAAPYVMDAAGRSFSERPSVVVRKVNGAWTGSQTLSNCVAGLGARLERAYLG